jgi:hypothetical protein
MVIRQADPMTVTQSRATPSSFPRRKPSQVPQVLASGHPRRLLLVLLVPLAPLAACRLCSSQCVPTECSRPRVCLPLPPHPPPTMHMNPVASRT